MSEVVVSIMETCAQMGDIELSGIKLESAHRDLLDVSTGSLDRHVSMQPAAMAYFGSLKKEAKRRLDSIQRQYERWERRKYAEAKSAVESGTAAKSSIKVEDVKARFVIDNGPEIEKWDARIEQAQAEYDTLDVWMEAWKQKSFSLREFVSIEEDERYSGSSSIMEKEGGEHRKRRDDTPGEHREVGIGKVREILRKRREQSGAQK